MDYRKSSYVIQVCIDSNKKQYLLMQGYTGALDIVPEYIGILFSEENRNTPLPGDLSDTTFSFLLKRGYITSKSKEEETELVKKIAKAIHLYHQQTDKRFTFVVSYNCNFRCPYCFENVISNHGKGWSKRMMTKEMVDNAYHSMSLIEPNESKHFKEISLYGGEPLMEENLDIVHYIIDEGISKGYKFSAISNGYDLDLFDNLLGENKIRKIQITLDGARKYHNSRRFHYRKGASYDKILNNIKMALDKGVKIRVRSNIDKDNFESMNTLLDDFNKLRLFDYTNFRFYPALLRKNTNDLSNESDKKNFNYFTPDAFEDNISMMKDAKNSISDLLFSAFKHKKPVMLQSSHCGANTGIYIFDPEGNIYCCLEAVGIKKHIIGHYDADHVDWTSNYKAWKERYIGILPVCAQCRYALICGGGCTVKVALNDYTHPYCDHFPEIFEINARKAYKNFVCAE